MKVGDRVTKEKVLATENPVGTVVKISDGYVVVRWDKINGDWHYTHAQSHLLEIVRDL